MDHLRDLYLNQDYLGVRVNQNITPDINSNSVAITISVVTGPKISVTVEGLDISKDQLRKTLPFYRQGGVNDFALEEGARRLQEYAQSKGYFFARGRAPRPPRGPNP